MCCNSRSPLSNYTLDFDSVDLVFSTMDYLFLSPLLYFLFCWCVWSVAFALDPSRQSRLHAKWCVWLMSSTSYLCFVRSLSLSRSSPFSVFATFFLCLKTRRDIAQSLAVLSFLTPHLTLLSSNACLAIIKIPSHFVCICQFGASKWWRRFFRRANLFWPTFLPPRPVRSVRLVCDSLTHQRTFEFQVSTNS